MAICYVGATAPQLPLQIGLRGRNAAADGRDRLRTVIPCVVNTLPVATGITTPHRDPATSFGNQLSVRTREGESALRGCIAHGPIVADGGIQGLPRDAESRGSKALCDVVPDSRLTRNDRCPRRNDSCVVAPKCDDLLDVLSLGSSGGPGLVGSDQLVLCTVLGEGGAAKE